MRSGKTEKRICKNCKNEFDAYLVKIRQGKGIFCSADCYQSYRQKHKGNKKYQNRLHQKKNKYGLSKDEYENLFISQNNCCAICNISFEICRANVDHNHENNIVRGLLCSNCNSGIAFLKENVEILKSAIHYLS